MICIVVRIEEILFLNGLIVYYTIIVRANERFGRHTTPGTHERGNHAASDTRIAARRIIPPGRKGFSCVLPLSRTTPAQILAHVMPRLQDGHAPRELLLAAGYIVGSIVRDQRPRPVSHGRRCRDRGPGLLRPSQDLGVEQLVQLVTDVGVHPSVDDGVGHGRGHGGQVADGERHVQLLGCQDRRSHQVGGQREHGQREPAHREDDSYA